MADARSSSSERTLQKALLNMYSKSGWHQTESSTAYSDKEKTTGTMKAPTLTLLGESTPETFFEKLTHGQVTSGLLPRFMFLEYNGLRPAKNNVSAFCEPAPQLVASVCDMAAQAIQMQSNDQCIHVVADVEAQQLLDGFDVQCDKRINESSDLYKHLWNRAHLKALRLAALVAVGCNNVHPVITATMAQWSINFVLRDVATIEARFMAETVGDGEYRYEAEVRTAVEAYLAMTPENREKYKTPKAIIDKPIIPFSYLRRRLRPLASFRNDRRGAAIAIQSALKDMTDAGILDLIPPIQRKKDFGLTADIYAVGDSW